MTALATLTSSGCSMGEVVALRAAPISHSLPIYMAIPQGKLLLARQAPLSREAHTRIADWLAQRPVHSDYVFTRFDGRGLQARA